MTPPNFAWQAWRLATSTFVSRGRRGTWSHPLLFAWQAWHLWRWAGSGGALGWHLATSTFVLRGRCGTWSHPPSFCVAGVALMALGWLWWRLWARLVAGDASQLCVAGVALGDIHLRFAWQAWRLVTSTFVLRGRRGTYGRLALVSQALSLSHTIFATQHLSHTIFHTPAFAPNFVTHHLSHTTLSPTSFDTPSFTHSFVTHHLSRTIFDTRLCHTPSLTHHLSHHYVTHHL